MGEQEQEGQVQGAATEPEVSPAKLAETGTETEVAAAEVTTEPATDAAKEGVPGTAESAAPTDGGPASGDTHNPAA